MPETPQKVDSDWPHGEFCAYSNSFRENDYAKGTEGKAERDDSGRGGLRR